MLELAYRIAFEAHKEQLDKAGKPYINHPVYVASQVKTEKEKVVALLHDVIEDTEITEQDLRKYKFPKDIIEAIMVLTKNKNEDYYTYIEKIKNNELAKNVKIADLKHNSDLTRLKDIGEKDIERVEKYEKALEILKQ